MARNNNRASKKRKVPFLNYNVNHVEDYEIIAGYIDTKKIVFQNTLAAIDHSLSIRKKTADIFLIDKDLFVSLNRDKWVASLENAIEFFSQEGIEDYETCIKCKDLIKKIGNGR